MTRLILASTSASRRSLLQRLALPFAAVSPEVDEASYCAQRGISSPFAIATALARAKAEAVFARASDAVVIGSDQVCTDGRETFGKPGTDENAVEQLLRLQGRVHELITAVSVVVPQIVTVDCETSEFSCEESGDGTVLSFVDTCRMHMRALSRAECERYIALDQSLFCAGSYRVESLGIALFEQVEAQDFTAIEGLPLIRLSRCLRSLGYSIP